VSGNGETEAAELAAFTIAFDVPLGESFEITCLRAASIALDNLVADEAAAAAEYLAARYRREANR